MHVKKLKRKCSVRGCKNTTTFSISRTREMGNTVIICKECLKDAVAALEQTEPATGAHAETYEAKGGVNNAKPKKKNN